MAGKKKTELINMTDGAEESNLGGLNDGPDFVEDEEIEFVDHAVLDDDPEEGTELEGEPEPEVEAESVGDADPEPEPDSEEEPKSEEDEEPEPEPEIDPAEKRFNEMVGLIASKDEKIEKLVQTVEMLTKKVIEPEPEPTPERIPPVKPDAEEMDIEDYVDATIQYREDLKAFDAETQRIEDDSVKAETETKQTKTLQNIRAIHEKDYAEEAEELPVLKDNENVRNIWAKIYNDPATAYNTREDGVLRATRALKAKAKADGVDLYNLGKEPAPATEPKIDPEKLAADEAARTERLASGTMHSSSNGTQSKGGNPTADQIDAAKKCGVSIKNYMATFNSLPKG